DQARRLVEAPPVLAELHLLRKRTEGEHALAADVARRQTGDHGEQARQLHRQGGGGGEDRGFGGGRDKCVHSGSLLPSARGREPSVQQRRVTLTHRGQPVSRWRISRRRSTPDSSLRIKPSRRSGSGCSVYSSNLGSRFWEYPAVGGAGCCGRVSRIGFASTILAAF